MIIGATAVRDLAFGVLVPLVPAVPTIFFALAARGGPLGRAKQSRWQVPIFAGTVIGTCALVTWGAVVHKPSFNPFFFEDCLSMDAVYASVLVVVWVTRRTPGARLRRGLTLAFLAFLLAFGVAEAVLRVLLSDAVVENRIGWAISRKPNDDRFRILHKRIPDREEQALYHARGVRLNEYFGLRDDKVFPALEKGPGEKRVVWLGDSTTEAGQVPPDRRFAALLEASIGVPQYVLAVGDTGTDFAATVEARFFDLLQPDVVMLAFNPENDCEDFGKPFPACGFKPFFVPRDGKVVPNCEDERKGLLFDLYTAPPSIAVQYLGAFSFVGNVLLDSRERAWRSFVRAFVADANPFPAFRGWQWWRLDNVAAICDMIGRIDQDVRGRGGKFGVVAFPLSSRLEPELAPGLRSVAHPRVRAACYDALRACVKEKGLPFLDGVRLFREGQPPIDDETAFLPEVRHLTVFGHRRFFELVLPFEKGLLR